MLASIFVASGLNALRRPGPKADVAEPVIDLIDEVVEVATDGYGMDNETYVRINGGVQLGAGLLLALNRLPRLASAALAVSLVPTTLAGHRFWEVDGAEKQKQQVEFLKNVGLVGGLILAAADHEGRPSVAWRIGHRRAQRSA